MSNTTAPATVPCANYFTTAKGEHWCSVEVDTEHAHNAYAAGRTTAHEGPCVEISVRYGAVENTVWAAMKSNAHLLRPDVEAADQVWERRDEAGRDGERVCITSIGTVDGEVHVDFIITRAASGCEAELGSDGSMKAIEFKQRYRYLRGVTAVKWWETTEQDALRAEALLLDQTREIQRWTSDAPPSKPTDWEAVAEYATKRVHFTEDEWAHIAQVAADGNAVAKASEANGGR